MAYYYGWTDEYIDSLDVQTYCAYLNSTYVLEKRSQLNSIISSISAMQKPQHVKKKITKLENDIKGSFEREISAVNAKYLAEEMLKNG